MKYNTIETNVAKQQITTLYFLLFGFLAFYVVNIFVEPNSGFEWAVFLTTLFILFAFVESFLALVFYTYFYLQSMHWY